MRLGVDDTDGPNGGCTTYVLTELVALARTQGLDVLGEPRLVRLNPNVPWKTRGNAALSLLLGHGSGPGRAIGEIGGKTVLAFSRGRSATVPERSRFRVDAWELVQGLASPEEGTDPALVVADRALPERMYEAAVTGVVAPASVEDELRAEGAWFRTALSSRGIVGAAAAAAWPGRRRTWELISYRMPGASGSRLIDRRSVLEAARRERSLFLCHDPATRRLLVAPHTACPILYGLRSRTRIGALRARRWVRSEPVGRWLLFRTNQGTGDHLRGAVSVPLPPFTPARLEGTVGAAPRDLRGGHVAFQLAVGPAHVECRVFEPTKSLPTVARGLAAGDRLELWGGTGADPTFRVEGIRIVALAPRFGRAEAPRCRACGRRGRSLGSGRGYRCPGCHHRWPPEAARRPPRTPTVRPGTYHPTPSARRHLAPLGPEYPRVTPN
jgi:tRNA(Ile2)-agmatinylcytidine synthase